MEARYAGAWTPRGGNDPSVLQGGKPDTAIAAHNTRARTLNLQLSGKKHDIALMAIAASYVLSAASGFLSIKISSRIFGAPGVLVTTQFTWIVSLLNGMASLLVTGGLLRQLSIRPDYSIAQDAWVISFYPVMLVAIFGATVSLASPLAIGVFNNEGMRLPLVGLFLFLPVTVWTNCVLTCLAIFSPKLMMPLAMTFQAVITIFCIVFGAGTHSVVGFSLGIVCVGPIFAVGLAYGRSRWPKKFGLIPDLLPRMTGFRDFSERARWSAMSNTFLPMSGLLQGYGLPFVFALLFARYTNTVAAGNWIAYTRLSDAYLALVTTIVHTRFFSVLGGMTIQERLKWLQKVGFVSTLVFVSPHLLAAAFPSLVAAIFLSTDFTQGISRLALQQAGMELVRFPSFVMVSMVSALTLRPSIHATIFSLALVVGAGVSAVTLHRIGLHAYYLGFGFAPVIFSAVAIWLVRRATSPVGAEYPTSNS